MSEWFKEPVLKTGDSQEPWVRIPLSPPLFRLKSESMQIDLQPCRSTQVAIRGSPAKGVAGDEPGGGSNPPFCAKRPEIQRFCWISGRFPSFLGRGSPPRGPGRGGIPCGLRGAIVYPVVYMKKCCFPRESGGHKIYK